MKRYANGPPGPRLLEQADNAAGGSAADNGIVQQYQTLSLYDRTVGRQLHLHARIPQLLCGLDKGTSHIAVFDKSHLIGRPLSSL